MISERTARLAFWSVTGLMIAAALASMALWVPNIGMHEDYFMVAAMTGNEPDFLSWLWSQNNEHRLPVQRLIYVTALWLTGDFRSGMILSQALLVALAWLLARAMAVARGGGYRLADIAFPLALLNLGHWENLLWGWQIQFVWSVFLTGLVLVVIIRQGRVMARADAVTVAACFLLLPLSGANGIATACAMVPWAVLTALLQWRSPEDGARAAARDLLAAGALALLASGAYFIGYVRPPWSPPLADWWQFRFAAEAYFAMGLGTGARYFQTPLAYASFGICLIGALVALVACLRTWRAPDARAFGLLSFIGAGVALGLIIALTRGAYPYRMPDRYALFAVMPLIGAVAAWSLYGPRIARPHAMTAAAIFLVLFLPANIRAGFDWRDWWVDGVRKVEADIAAGLSVEDVAARNYTFLLHSSADRLATAITQLRDAGIGPFARLPDGP